MQESFDHSKTLLVLTPHSSDFIHTQTHEIMVNDHQELVHVNFLQAHLETRCPLSVNLCMHLTNRPEIDIILQSRFYIIYIVCDKPDCLHTLLSTYNSFYTLMTPFDNLFPQAKFGIVMYVACVLFTEEKASRCLENFMYEQALRMQKLQSSNSSVHVPVTYLLPSSYSTSLVFCARPNFIKNLSDSAQDCGWFYVPP